MRRKNKKVERRKCEEEKSERKAPAGSGQEALIYTCCHGLADSRIMYRTFHVVTASRDPLSNGICPRDHRVQILSSHWFKSQFLVLQYSGVRGPPPRLGPLALGAKQASPIERQSSCGQSRVPIVHAVKNVMADG